MDFLPNRFGAFPLGLLGFLSKHEEGGHVDSRSLGNQTDNEEELQLCFHCSDMTSAHLKIIYVIECCLSHRGEAKVTEFGFSSLLSLTSGNTTKQSIVTATNNKKDFIISNGGIKPDLAPSKI